MMMICSSSGGTQLVPTLRDTFAPHGLHAGRETAMAVLTGGGSSHDFESPPLGPSILPKNVHHRTRHLVRVFS